MAMKDLLFTYFDENEMQDYWGICSAIDPHNFKRALGLAIIEKKSKLYKTN